MYSYTHDKYTMSLKEINQSSNVPGDQNIVHPHSSFGGGRRGLLIIITKEKLIVDLKMKFKLGGTAAGS